MALLFDRLDKRKFNQILIDYNNEGFDRTLNDVRVEDLQIFEISNVADLVTRMEVARPIGSGKDMEIELDLSLFPNVAPPFESYWMELHLPRSMRLDRMPMERVGVWFLLVSADDEDHWRMTCSVWAEHRGEALPAAIWSWTNDKGKDNLWVTEAEPISPNHIKDFFPRDYQQAVFKEAYVKEVFTEAEDLEEYKDWSLERLEAERERNLKAIEASNEKMAKIHCMWLSATVLPTCLMAHSLLSCKNVTTDVHKPDPKLAKARLRKKGVAPVTFKTLAITPMGSGAREGSGQRIAIGGGNTALHLVRGHFKTFTPEKPLFGKHAGTYWWSPMARGKEEHGVVHKTYEVKP